MYFNNLRRVGVGFSLFMDEYSGVRTYPKFPFRPAAPIAFANLESQGSWRDFLLQLKARGLNGVQLVVSNDHSALKAAIRKVLPGVE